MVSGKKTVFWLFAAAFLLFAVLLFSGLRAKRKRLEAVEPLKRQSVIQ